MVLPSLLNQVISNPFKGGTMSSKMSVVAAIKLASSLGYTSGEPIMWKIVRALQSGSITPENLLKTTQ